MRAPARYLSEKSISEFFEAISRLRSAKVAEELAPAATARAAAANTSWMRRRENLRLEKVIQMAVK